RDARAGGRGERRRRGAGAAVVLCHGVLGYLARPEPVIDQLCRCVVPGGLVSIMDGNANAMAGRPALEGRRADALAAFDAATEVGVLERRGYARTVDGIGRLLAERGVGMEDWYGVWLFVDWLEFSGRALDRTDEERLQAAAAVELEASRRDPYRQLSRAFHVVAASLATHAVSRVSRGERRRPVTMAASLVRSQRCQRRRRVTW